MKARRFDFYPDDWLAGTITLDHAERGIYITAVAAFYSHGGPIKTVELRRLCKGDARVFKRGLDRLVELGKLIVKGAYLSNKRCETEVQNARKRVVSAVQNGRKGGRPSKKNSGLEKPNGKLPSPSPSPSPIQIQETDADASVGGACAPDTDTKPQRGKANGARKSRLPVDWQPDLDDCQYATGRGWNGRRIGEEADAFRDHHNANASTFADWNAAWRTWVRRADGFAAKRNGAVEHRPPRSGSFAAAVGNVMSRRGLG